MIKLSEELPNYYTLVWDYMATGEGQQIHVLADYFENKEEALQAFKHEFVEKEKHRVENNNFMTQEEKDSWVDRVWDWMKIGVQVTEGLHLETMGMKFHEENFMMGRRCLPRICISYNINCS